MNLLHDIDPGTPEKMNVIIEIPRGSHNKYEIDKKTGIIKLDRANYNAAPYPFEYGFVPQTHWEDGDALDVMLLASSPLYPGILVSVRPVALMEMTDSGDQDSKIIGVPVDDRRWDDVKDLNDLNKHNLKEFKHFFETSKQLKEGSPVVTVHGFKGKADAVAAFKHGIELYKKEFSK
ncbi:inorganic diphosphatase [Candidatus Kaiserbacteria bacterium]|nr:inorganic diphosphatase [Candidatus Kaiserbacteria bacterium]